MRPNFIYTGLRIRTAWTVCPRTINVCSYHTQLTTKNLLLKSYVNPRDAAIPLLRSPDVVIFVHMLIFCLCDLLIKGLMCSL